MSDDYDFKLINMADVEAKEVTWLWYPFFPMNKLTIIQGDPGEGKTTLILEIAARLSKGEPILEGDVAREPVNIIYQTAEDGLADTIKPRLVAANADTSRIYVIDESQQSLTMTDDRLREALEETRAKLVILDPLQAYLGANIDMHRANEIRPIMSKLSALAEKYECAIVLIGHMNKATGLKTTYRGLGSIDITAAARSVLLVSRLKDNPTVRVMAQIKSNLAPENSPIAFELNKETGFKFIGDFNISIDDLLNGAESSSKLNQAEDFLRDFLSDNKPKPYETIKKQAAYRSISLRTLAEAKKNIKADSKKIGKIWYWKLDNQECNNPCE